MPKASDYKGIKVWGIRCRQAESQIRAKQLIAADSNAPLNAIYYVEGADIGEKDGKWMTTDDIESETTREDFIGQMNIQED